MQYKYRFINQQIYRMIDDLTPSKTADMLYQRNRNKLYKRLLADNIITKEQKVCHHKSPIWRYFDHDRYVACNEEDVEFVTKEEHAKIHLDWINREYEYGFLTKMFQEAAKNYGVYLIEDWKLGEGAD